MIIILNKKYIFHLNHFTITKFCFVIILNRIEEEKRAIKRPLSTERYEDDRDRKRTTSDRRGFEPPPPPRFDLNR